MDKKEQQVTKLKNEGRVAAGKRLAEWNRKNKENLIKNKEQVESSGESSAPTSAQEPASATSNTTLYRAAIVLVAGIICGFYWKRNTTLKVAIQPENDIFKMN